MHQYARLVLLLLLLLPACTFHTTATEWNGRSGVNGKPVHMTSTTKVGLKLFVFLPFMGDMEVTGLVNDITKDVADKGGDKVRIFQAAQENYWYGFPPFTWIITPVISTVAADYEHEPGN